MRVLLALILCTALAQNAYAQAADANGRQPKQPAGVYLQTMAPLDDPRGFCFDLSGREPNFDIALQSHTCKESYDHRDQLYIAADAAKGVLRLAAYPARCLAAEGGKVFARDCAAAPAQKWRLSTGGAIRPSADPSMCVTVGDTSTEAGYPEEVSPAWLHRGLTIEKCDFRLASRQAWRLTKPVAPMHVGPEVPAGASGPAVAR